MTTKAKSTTTKTTSKATNKTKTASKSQTTKNTAKLPWYKNQAAIILLLVFFPPVGIPLFIKFMDKPQKILRIIISVAWALIFLASYVMYFMNSSRTFDVDGVSVKIECSSYCLTMEHYGDPEITKILAMSGITKIEKAPSATTDGKAEITVDINDTDNDVKVVVAEFKNNKVSKVYNKAFPEILYYSSDSSDTTVKYPASDVITKKRKDAENKKKEEERQKAEEAQRQKEEAEKHPSAVAARELCEKQFHKNYPWNGSKVHSILGVIADQPYSTDSYFYKVQVTIMNAYRSSYDAAMECTVQKSGDYIKITSFYVY